jgi:NAD/NADP transhydrogenase beta subunit
VKTDEEIAEQSEEEVLSARGKEHTVALYISRGLYVIAAICFAVALYNVADSSVKVHDLMTGVQGEMLISQSAIALGMIGNAFLTWVMLIAGGLLSTVIGLLVHSFVK